MALAEITNDQLIITLPVEKIYPGIKNDLEEYFNNLPIKVLPIKKLSQAQNGLIHVLLKQLGEILGYNLIEIKEIMKEQFSISKDLLEFSTAKCDSELANEFISFIIEKALDLDVNLYILGKQDLKYKNVIEVDNITQRYVIACLIKKICVICGKEHNEYNTIDLHHYNSVASIGGLEHDDGLKTPFMSLCREHHTEFHNIGIKDFEEKYHIEGIWLNPNLVFKMLDIYPNHFKLFRKRLKEGYYKNVQEV